MPHSVPRAGHSCGRGRAGGKLGQHLGGGHGKCFSDQGCGWGGSLRPCAGPGTPHTRIPRAHHSRQWEFAHSFYRQLREVETPAQSCPAGVKQPHDRRDRPHPRVQPSPPGCVLWANAVQHKRRDPRARHKLLLWSPCLAVKM